MRHTYSLPVFFTLRLLVFKSLLYKWNAYAFCKIVFFFFLLFVQSSLVLFTASSYYIDYSNVKELSERKIIIYYTRKPGLRFV